MIDANCTGVEQLSAWDVNGWHVDDLTINQRRENI